MKLEKLTKEQEALMPVVRDEWIKFAIGGNTEINREMAMKGLRWIYGVAKLDEPRVVFVGGPFALQIAVWYIEELAKRKKLPASVGASVWDSVRNSVRNSVRDSVGNSVWDSVRNSVGDSVGDSVRNSVVDSVGDSVRNSVRNSVGDSVVDSVRNSVRDSVRDSVGNSVGNSVVDSVWDSVRNSKKRFEEYGWCDLGGNSGWTAFVDYFERIGIKVHESFYPWKDLLRSGVFMSIYLKGFAIVCPRPSAVHKNQQGRLHKDLAPAIQWEGEDYFFLNGVRMKKEQVMMPAEKIDVKAVVNEQNVEVRRELIRKIGIERFVLKSGAKVLDKKGDYELLSVRLSDDVPDARYLKMKNPSIATWHVEGVEGNTVQEAINWRAGNIKENWEPCVLT